MALEQYLYCSFEDDKENARKVISFVLRKSSSLAFAGVLLAVGKRFPGLLFEDLRVLLNEPLFHSWDTSTTLPTGVELIGWTFQGEAARKAAEKWHAMPHRQLQLRQVVGAHLVVNPSTREKIAPVRKAIESRLEGTGADDPSRYDLEKLLAELDAENWSVSELEEALRVECRLPDYFQKVGEQQLAPIRQNLFLMELPFSARRALDSQTSLTEGACEEWWAAIDKVNSMEVALEHNDTRIHALCGCASVLFCRGRDWLRRFPDRERWCHEQVTTTIQNPPPSKYPRTGIVRTDWEWDSFCAQALPHMWAEEPSNAELRECVAYLATCSWYRTVSYLFFALGPYRAQLGCHYEQLYHLAMRWARVRFTTGAYLHDDANNGNAQWWLRLARATFVAGHFAPDAPAWEDLACPASKPEREDRLPRKRRKHNRPGVDLYLIQAIHSYVCSLDRLEDKSTREECIGYWKKCLCCLLWMLGEETQDGDRFERPPDTWDRWVLEALAHLIIRLEVRDNPRQFWEPIMDLGATAHNWIESFLTDLLIHGLSGETPTKSFKREWVNMLDYALASPKWIGEGRDVWDLGDLWCHLFGLDQIGIRLWRPEHQDIINEVSDRYARWSKNWLHQEKCAARFARLLTAPVGGQLLLPGVVWLAGEMYKWSVREDDHYGLRENVTAALELCWRSHGSRLRQNQEALEAFRRLLSMMAQLQYAPALELQRTVAQSSK